MKSITETKPQTEFDIFIEGLQKPKIPEVSTYSLVEVRYWISDYKKWESGEGPKPGPHPDPDNLWNLKPEIFEI